MNETVIVVMLKDAATGFLEKELGTYSVTHENLIHNIFALEAGPNTNVHIRLTTERDLADWEFSAVFDYYDTEPLIGACALVAEDESGYNPMWEVVFEFSENQVLMQERLSHILNLHMNELNSVYEAIKDLQEDYSNNDKEEV